MEPDGTERIKWGGREDKENVLELVKEGPRERRRKGRTWEGYVFSWVFVNAINPMIISH